jgi:hypothetical protein
MCSVVAGTLVRLSASVSPRCPHTTDAAARADHARAAHRRAVRDRDTRRHSLHNLADEALNHRSGMLGIGGLQDARDVEHAAAVPR